jgi:mRNA-degrading endonuclease RelE of RelBE toxin-antitoxin system
MEYTVEVKESAIKELAKLQAEVGARVLSSLEMLALNPRPVQSRKLRQTASSYRLRVGD